MPAGIKAYVDHLRKKTLQYLDVMEQYYCDDENVTRSEPSGNQSISLPGLMRPHYRFIDPIIRESCKEDFTYYGVDGLKSSDTDHPTCAGRGYLRSDEMHPSVPMNSFCQEMAHARVYVSNSWKKSTLLYEETCKNLNNPPLHDLPVCFYDCNHPTECIQTGRYI